MDPFSIGLSAVSFGLQLFGASKKSSSISQNTQAINAATADMAQWQSKIAQTSGMIAGKEQNINDLKQQQMNMQGYRSQLENVRNLQRARAMATNAAVSQGAQGGTGLMGGLAQVTNQSLFNQVGQNQSLQTGNQTAAFNKDISNFKMDIAQYQSNVAIDQGKIGIANNNMQADVANANSISSLGNSLMSAGPTIGKLGSNIFGGNNFNSLFGGGSPSGYGA